MPIKPTDSSNTLKAQEYAAIHLKVPNSGTEWLDQMIHRARELDAEGFHNLVVNDKYAPEPVDKVQLLSEDAKVALEPRRQPCKGPNCGTLDDTKHSPECVWEHDATANRKTKPQGPPNPPKGGKGRKIA